MKKQIEITDDQYNRLASHREGFDTPQDVIERLLDFFENHAGGESTTKPMLKPENFISQSHSLDIIFHPDDEEGFKAQFLDKKKAWILVSMTNGSTQLKTWECNRLTKASSIKGNLLSGHLRNWKQKGITKAELSVNKNDLV